MIENVYRMIGWVVFMAGFSLWLWKYPDKRDAFDPKLAFISFKERLKGLDFSWRWFFKHFAVIIGGIALCFLLIFPAISLSQSGQEMVSGDAGDVTSDNHPVDEIGGFSVVVLGFFLGFLPAVEEKVFRVEFLEYLKNKIGGGWGKFFAVLLAGVVFGLFHLFNPGTGLFAFVPPMVLGWVFGLVYLYSGFWGAYLTHGGYNVLFLILVAV